MCTGMIPFPETINFDQGQGFNEARIVTNSWQIVYVCVF